MHEMMVSGEVSVWHVPFRDARLLASTCLNSAMLPLPDPGYLVSGL